MKNFTTETDVPTLKLSFLVAVSAQEEQVQDIYDEALGKHWDPKEFFLKKYTQLKNYSSVVVD